MTRVDAPKTMTLWVLGSNHRLTPPSQLAAPSARREEILTSLLRLQTQEVIHGAVLVSTCNRLELILDTEADIDQLRTTLLGSELPTHQASDLEAVQFLLRVTTGLESMVRGEDQIMGQVREAFKVAENHGLLSGPLRVLRTRLVDTARDIRKRADLCREKVSVAGFAARQLLEAGDRLAVIGAGETGRLAMEALSRRGQHALVVNRTFEHAQALANHFGCEAMSLADFLASRAGGEGPQLDGILIAVDCTRPLLSAEHLQGIKRVVDVSMPPVLDPSVREMSDIEILDLDAISRLVDAEDERRARSLDVAAELVQARARRLHKGLAGKGRNLGTVIEQHVDSALQELEGALRTTLSHLSEEDRGEIREVLLRTARRNAHYHLTDIKQLIPS